MKRLTAFLLILTVCLGLFTACGKDKIPDGECELWVVTELTQKYGMNDQAERIIAQFQERYPNVTVKLDILPTDDEERAVYLEKIRTQIMGGGGPDVYLMPTHNYVPDPSSLYDLEKQVNPLFWNVSQVMYNGLFYDISEFYDEDESLEKEELNTSVMDGVVVDGARYVLPLRYDFGVYLVDRKNLEKTGLDVSIFETGADNVIRTILETGNSGLAEGFSYAFHEFYFSDFVDNASCSVKLTAEEVSEFLRLYQGIRELAGKEPGTCYSRAEQYIEYNSYFASARYAYDTESLSNVMSAVAAGKYLDKNLEMYPQLASDGTLHAIVRYYAAVGAGADHPRLAYEFIKLFLSDEAQYESYLNDISYARASEPACIGWPVRTVGSVDSRFTTFEILLGRADYTGRSLAKKRMLQLKKGVETLTDEDVPAVSWQVDKVMFPIIMAYEDSLSCCVNVLNDYEHNNAALDVDIAALAQEYIDNIQLYLDEA